MKEEPEVLFEELLERAKAGEPKAQTEVIIYGFLSSLVCSSFQKQHCLLQNYYLFLSWTVSV